MKILLAIFFVLCSVILLGVAFADYQILPPRVASHFDLNGNANGRMATSEFTCLMIGIGLAGPLLLVGVIYLVRFLPSSLLNVPNREYWRDPRNYRRACDYLLLSSVWFGCVLILWQTAFFHLLATANLASRPHLNGIQLSILTAVLLAFTGVWIAMLLCYFSKPGATAFKSLSA